MGVLLMQSNRGIPSGSLWKIKMKTNEEKAELL